jgi:secreted PhoX family phosphatase
MKRSGTVVKVHRRNTNKKKWYGHVSRMNENMFQETNRKFTRRRLDQAGDSKLGNMLCKRKQEHCKKQQEVALGRQR